MSVLLEEPRPATPPQAVRKHWWPNVSLSGGLFWSFWIKRILLARVLPLVLLLFVTVNAWGLSYLHWVEGWVFYFVQGLPTIPPDRQMEFFIFLVCGVAGACSFYYFAWRCRHKGFGQFLLWRVAPVALLAALAVNPWVSYGKWAYDWWNTLLARTSWSFDDGDMANLAGFAVVGLLLVLTWHYVMLKAWQGLGSKKATAAIVVLLVAALIWYFRAIGFFPTTMRWTLTAVELIAGIVVGLSFSATLMDRLASGTVGSTAIIKEIDVEAGHHDAHHDQGEDALLSGEDVPHDK